MSQLIFFPLLELGMEHQTTSHYHARISDNEIFEVDFLQHTNFLFRKARYRNQGSNNMLPDFYYIFLLTIDILLLSFLDFSPLRCSLNPYI